MNDLISRAAARDVINTWGRQKSEKVRMGLLHRDLDAIPAVDAVSVVHAHWIETTIPANTTGYGGVGQEKKKGILCSECRCAFDISLLWANDYCPHCGAKMDGESK